VLKLVKDKHEVLHVKAVTVLSICW